MLKLKAKVRKILGKKVKALRKKGLIPAVLYGYKTKPLLLEVNYTDFSKIFEKVGESTLLKLEIEGLEDEKEKKERTVLIYDISRDPVTDKFNHIDFYQVRMDKPITTEVSLVFEGEAPAVKELDGVLVKNISHLEVKALPANLPHELKVNISSLKTFDDIIHVKDIEVPEGVEILANPDEVVALVTPPRTEEELKALEEEVAEEKPEEVEEKEEEKVEEVSEEKEKEEKEEKEEQ